MVNLDAMREQVYERLLDEGRDPTPSEVDSLVYDYLEDAAEERAERMKEEGW